MDAFDRKILGLYQTDTRRPAESIGESVGLSAAAVQRRLKRLREAGVIRGEIASLDATALGFPVICVLMLTLASRPSPRAQLDRFKREIGAEPMVQQCYQVTGSADLVLIVAAPSMEAYAAFVRRRIEGDEAVARFDTFVVLDAVKVGLSLPLP
jgi:DNA-binding Lrp family transcriptional regulator